MRKSDIKKDVFQVFSSNLIKTLVSVISIFIIPMALSVDEYGYFKLFSLYSSYIGLSHLGYCDGIFLRYGGVNLPTADKRKISIEHTSFILYELILTIIVSLIGILTMDWIIILFVVQFLPCTLISYYTYMYQATGEFKFYSEIYSFSSILLLLFDLILIFVIHAKSGIFFAAVTVLSNYIVFFYALITFKKRYSIGIGKFNASCLFINMKTGILLTLGNLSYQFFVSIDKWFVKILLGHTFFSYYSFAAQLLSALNMFANPIALTLYSHMSRKKDHQFEYRLKLIMISLLFFMLSGVFVIRFIVSTFTSKYNEATNVIIILFLAQVFMLLNTSIYINLYNVYKAQKKYFINLITVIIISVILNAIIYTINHSIESISIATLVCIALWSILNLRNFPYLKLRLREYVFILLCSLSYLLLSILFSWWFGLILYFFIYIVLLITLMNGVSKYFASFIKSKIVHRR